MTVTVTQDPVTRADIIAALTENDVLAMNGSDVTRLVLDGLSREQLCSMLCFLSGAAPRSFARAAFYFVDPGQVADGTEASS